MAASEQLAPVVLEGVDIIFRNFTGKEGPYNSEGDRNFGVILPPDIANDMAKAGWNVKTLKPREVDEGEELEEAQWLPVAVSYKARPPQIYLITSRGKTPIGEKEVETLDWADIARDEETGVMLVDLIVRAYHWKLSNGKEGVKAMVQSLYVTIIEDPLAQKYGAMDTAGESGPPELS